MNYKRINKRMQLLIESSYAVKQYQYNDLNYNVKYNNDHLHIELPDVGYIEGYKMPIDLDVAHDLSPEEIQALGIKDPYFTIKHVEVFDEHKGKGYGNELMAVFLDITNKLGLNQILLNASPLGESGLPLNNLITFYEDWGFKVIKQYKDNAIMMLNRI